MRSPPPRINLTRCCCGNGRRGPLGLRDTTFSPTPAQCARLLLGYHAPRANEPPVCMDTAASAGSSGLYSTANDMARWLEYLLGTSEIKQNPVAQAVYLSPKDLVSVKGLDHASEPAGIGLGWMVLDAPETATRIVEKTGWGSGVLDVHCAGSGAAYGGVSGADGGWAVADQCVSRDEQPAAGAGRAASDGGCARARGGGTAAARKGDVRRKGWPGREGWRGPEGGQS